jgi:ElaB/YqjD/DUF883 family membrane-anchored ribosome-binding protein
MAATNGTTQAHRTKNKRRTASRSRRRELGRLARVGHEARRAIGQKVDDFRDDISDGAHRVGGAMQQVETALKHLIRERPWRTVAIGVSVVALAGAGVAFGRYWMQRK